MKLWQTKGHMDLLARFGRQTAGVLVSAGNKCYVTGEGLPPPLSGVQIVLAWTANPAKDGSFLLLTVIPKTWE